MVVYRHGASVSVPPSPISLFIDIGQGAGVSGATGVRPFLPALLIGALARNDSGVDFDGTDYSFLESQAFLLAVLVLAVLAYALNERGPQVAGRRSQGVNAPKQAGTRWLIVLITAAVLGLGLAIRHRPRRQ